jgi:hypothetical protein
MNSCPEKVQLSRKNRVVDLDSMTFMDMDPADS